MKKMVQILRLVFCVLLFSTGVLVVLRPNHLEARRIPSMQCYFDDDGDGYARAVSYMILCPPESKRLNQLHGMNDCNDMRPDRHPGATELCDGFDNDCDTTRDENLNCTRPETCYLDLDGDGYGVGAGYRCNEVYTGQYAVYGDPLNQAWQPGDYNDRDSNAYPGSMEINLVSTP